MDMARGGRATSGRATSGWAARLTRERSGSEAGWPIWQTCLLRALLTIAIGVIALLFPLSALVAFTFVFALYAVADGLFCLTSGGRRAWAREPGSGFLLFRGFIGILLGAAFLAAPLLVTYSYSVVALTLLGVWITVTGIVEIRHAFRNRRQLRGEWLLFVSGLLSVALGIAIPLILALRSRSFIALAWIVAIYALFSGLTMLWKALALRRAVIREVP
jgi:uncharacterized membrane protein HdeD (DUF308 family)